MASCCTPSTMWLKSDQTPEFLRSIILGLLGPYLVAAMCTFRCSVALFNVLHENCCISLNTSPSCENMKIALFFPPTALWNYTFHKYKKTFYVHTRAHSLHMHHSTHRWSVVMVAGTSEPTLAETSSPLSATLSRGDIQPEPRGAENCGEGTIVVIYVPAVPLMHFILLLHMSAMCRDKSAETP